MTHSWGREIPRLGYTVRLIPPANLEPFLKRHRNDAADAEAIAEAALQPTVRFVAVRSEEQPPLAVLFRTRQLFVAQRIHTDLGHSPDTAATGNHWHISMMPCGVRDAGLLRLCDSRAGCYARSATRAIQETTMPVTAADLLVFWFDDLGEPGWFN